MLLDSDMVLLKVIIKSIIKHLYKW